MHPDSLRTLETALSAHLEGLAPALRLAPGVRASLRGLHLATEEADMNVRDERAEFVASLVRRSEYPIRVSLREFSAAGIRDAIVRTYPDDAAGLLGEPARPSKMAAKKGG